MELRGYSPRTVDSYYQHLKRFLVFTDKSVDSLIFEDVRIFLHSLIKKKLSTSYINGSYSVCQLFFSSVLKQSFTLSDVPRVKNTKKLPTVLSRSEVDRIIEHVSYLKLEALLLTIYSAGLRVSEAVNLKVSDIDSKNMQIFIRSGKGDKDRYTILSHTNLQLLRQYFKAFRPTDWLFPSYTYPKQHLSVRSVQQAFHSARNKAGICKPATVHTLRHSFATHLLISGTDLYTIMKLLGHSSIQSTSVYLHLAPTRVLSVKSPLDMEVHDFE